MCCKAPLLFGLLLLPAAAVLVLCAVFVRGKLFMAIQLLTSMSGGHLTAVRSAAPLPRLAVSDWKSTVDFFVIFFSLWRRCCTTLLSGLSCHRCDGDVLSLCPICVSCTNLNSGMRVCVSFTRSCLFAFWTFPLLSAVLASLTVCRRAWGWLLLGGACLPVSMQWVCGRSESPRKSANE